MAARSGTERGLRGFTLDEVPEGIRFRALDKLLKTDGSPDGILVATMSFADRVALGVAAETPSDRIYWVSRSAWERVIG